MSLQYVVHLTTYLDLESREILRSGFDFKSNLTSAIGDLENRGFLASYVSHHKAMAYDSVYHHDYLQDMVDKRIQDERPLSIILALDEFQFQYKNAIMDQDMEMVCVPIGHVAIFLSALSYCGGENSAEDYVYCLFAYVVSDEVDYPQGVIERDVKDDIVVREEGGI